MIRLERRKSAQWMLVVVLLQDLVLAVLELAELVAD
jgi:hypothetical protein